jgi:hypothetical protein
MQYLITVIAEGNEEPKPGEAEAIDRFNEGLQEQGYWVFANGLANPSAATVIDARGQEPLFTDGPFLESKEHMAGLWIIDAPDLDVALKLAVDGSKACNRKLELRPFYVFEDCR